VDAGRSATYSYDSLYRLTSAITTGSTNYPKWGLSESYDRYGNRTAQSTITGQGCTGITCPTNSVAVSSTTNRISSGGYAYDANGNMTNDGANALVYDAENRTLSATNGSASGTYTYDGNNLRVKKVSGGTTTITIFSGGLDIAEYPAGAALSSPTNEYIYSGSQKIALLQSGTTYYFHNDHLSPRVRTNTSGAIVDQRGHFPFGETWYSPAGAPLLFTGYYRDAESGNDYAMARYNVNRLGRFSSPDPISGSISDSQSLNRYLYTENNPINATDPSGMVTIACKDADLCFFLGGSGGGGGGQTCIVDGADMPCSIVFAMLNNGSAVAVQCPDNNCGALHWTPDGQLQRYVPPTMWSTPYEDVIMMHLVIGHWANIGYAEDEYTSGWMGTRTFFSNWVSGSFYRSELSEGGCLATFQEAASEPMHVIHYASETTDAAPLGLMGAATGANALASALDAMRRAKTLAPGIGPVAIAGVRAFAASSASAASIAEGIAEHTPVATAFAIDGVLAYGVYQEARAAINGRCH
jgi:RHS repeat-associated protein